MKDKDFPFMDNIPKLRLVRLSNYFLKKPSANVCIDYKPTIASLHLN